MKRRPGEPDPKTVDQPLKTPNGSPTENAKFFADALDFKNGKRNRPKLIKAYEKIVSRVIPNLRRLKKIRNLVAHSAVISPKRVKKLLENHEIALLLLDYPDSLEEISRQIRRDFLYLANVKEFRHKKNATNPNAAVFGAYKFLEEMTDV